MNKSFKRFISTMLVACMAMSMVAGAAGTEEASEAEVQEIHFEQITIEHDANGKLIKDIALIGNTYYYRAQNGDQKIAFQITDKNYYSITISKNGDTRHTQGYMNDIYTTYTSEAGLEKFVELILNGHSEFAFLESKPSEIVATIVRAADPVLVGMANNEWGNVGSKFIGGASKYVNGKSYSCTLYLANTRNFGEEFRLQISAGTVIDTIEFFADIPFTILKSIISFAEDGVSGAIKTAKDFIGKKCVVENIATKSIYVNNESSYSYYSGWDCKLLYLCGDRGWTPAANYSYSIKNPDFDNNDTLYTKAAQNYANAH